MDDRHQSSTYHHENTYESVKSIYAGFFKGIVNIYIIAFQFYSVLILPRRMPGFSFELIDNSVSFIETRMSGSHNMKIPIPRMQIPITITMAAPNSSFDLLSISRLIYSGASWYSK